MGLALVLLFLESHSFSFGQPSGARGTFSVVSGGAEAAILSARGGFLLRHRELKIGAFSIKLLFLHRCGDDVVNVISIYNIGILIGDISKKIFSTGFLSIYISNITLHNIKSHKLGNRIPIAVFFCASVSALL